MLAPQSLPISPLAFAVVLAAFVLVLIAKDLQFSDAQKRIAIATVAVVAAVALASTTVSAVVLTCHPLFCWWP
jgi:hypothetical protein